MKRYITLLLMLLACWFTALVAVAQQNPYLQPLNAQQYFIQTVVTQPKRLGKTVLQENAELAVKVLVEVKNYLPRALEPQLLIAGEPVGYSIGVIEVSDGISVLGFHISDPRQIVDGAEVAIQMGTDKRTRTKLSQPLQMSKIAPLSADTAEKFNLPRSFNQ